MSRLHSPLRARACRVMAAVALAAVLLLGAGLAVPRSAQAASDEASGGGVVSAEVAPDAAPSNVQLWVRAVLRGLTAAAVILLLIGAAVLFFENRFIFRPTKEPLVDWRPPGRSVQEVALHTRDGLRLDAWWHPGRAEGDSAQPVVLFCHDSTGNITYSAETMCALAEMGPAVLLFDYRGYGRSDGTPSELGLYLDVDAAYAHLVKLRKIPPAQIVCFGRSLGAGVALHLALRRPTGGLIMEGPFLSVPAMARRRLLVRPFTFLIKNQFDCGGGVRRLTVPLLVVHGDQDEMVPFAQGRAVFAAAPKPKQFFRVEGARHNETLSVGGTDYLEALRGFCRGCLEGHEGK